MTAFYLLVPFLFIRFIFLSLLDRKATGRAVYFASMQGKEIIAYYLYQLSTLYPYASDCSFLFKSQSSFL